MAPLPLGGEVGLGQTPSPKGPPTGRGVGPSADPCNRCGYSPNRWPRTCEPSEYICHVFLPPTLAPPPRPFSGPAHPPPRAAVCPQVNCEDRLNLAYDFDRWRLAHHVPVAHDPSRGHQPNAPTAVPSGERRDPVRRELPWDGRPCFPMDVMFGGTNPAPPYLWWAVSVPMDVGAERGRGRGRAPNEHVFGFRYHQTDMQLVAGLADLPVPPLPPSEAWAPSPLEPSNPGGGESRDGRNSEFFQALEYSFLQRGDRESTFVPTRIQYPEPNSSPTSTYKPASQDCGRIRSVTQVFGHWLVQRSFGLCTRRTPSAMLNIFLLACCAFPLPSSCNLFGIDCLAPEKRS